MPARDKPEARRALGTLELRCPPLPQTLVEALRLIDRPDAIETARVTRMVQRDPIVVAKLLQTVNSAYYGLRQRIDSAERAVVMLGPVAVAGMVLGMHMLKLRGVVDGPARPCFERLIRHSLAAAFLARHFVEGQRRRSHVRTSNLSRSASAKRLSDAASALTEPPMGAAFTAGLLHDFGKVILIYNFHAEAHRVYDEHALDHELSTADERELERLLFGCDHCEAGEYAGRKLNFPDTLIEVIGSHHDPIDAAATYDERILLHAAIAANLTSKAMGYSFARRDDPGDALKSHLVWNAFIDPANPDRATADRIINDFVAQQEALDHYVNEMTGEVI